jgi:4'-phosphopantetheinyl transferase
LTYILEEIEKNKDVNIKVLRYSEVELNVIDLTIFNEIELDDFKSFKSKKRQLEYFYSRLLWLSFNQIEFIKYRPSGKPFLHHGFISISHSNGQVAIAFSNTKEVGMDLEYQSSKVQKVKTKYLHSKENYSGIKDLTTIWTIKEAIYKLYDSKLLFFKQHIIITNIKPSIELKVCLDGNYVYPNIKTFELKCNFILSFAQ